jgi:peptidoglycan-associated lipoprotein
MRTFLFRVLGIFFYITLGMAAASCSQRTIEPEEPLVADTGQPRKEIQINKDEPAVEQVDLKTAYFDYDKAYLRADAKKALRANAQWLKSHADANLQIEGHCDERGTAEYNMRLGEKRAASARKFLIELGITPSRISTVSYGATSGGRTTWSHNRKAAFVAIYSK